VLTSQREGMPNVLLEAMACELPSIVRFLPGVTDFLVDDGISASLIYRDDPNDLAAKISLLFSERESGNKMGSTARHFIGNNFSFDLISRKIFDLYWKVLGGSN
jgi:glycosyltransferase involved in cell wall biosynthesis